LTTTGIEPAPRIIGHRLFDNFWPIIYPTLFCTLDGKRFLLSDIAQDVPVLTDMHVPTLARLLNVLQLLVVGLCELLKFFVCFIHSA